MIGPVGLALTNSTLTRSPRVAAPEVVARLEQRRRAPRGTSASAMNRLRKPGPGDLDPLDRVAQPLAERLAQPLGDLPRRLAQRGASSIAALVE